VELSDLKGDSYAESLVQTINTALANKGGRIDAIQDLLTELYNKLVTDQKKADGDWSKRETSLNKTVSETETLISKLADQIATAQKTLSETNTKIAKATVNVAQYKKQKTDDETMVQTLHIKRNADAAVYKQNVQNHQDLVMALDAVVKELNKLRTSDAGVGRPAHVKAMTQETRDATWRKAHPALLEIFTENDIANFVQVATEADQDQLAKLVDMLLALKRSAQKSLADDDENEQDSVKHFKKALTRLQSDVTLLGTTLKRQNDNLTKYNRQKVSLETEIHDKQALKIKNETFLAQTKEIRRQEKLKYETDVRGREREKNIIRKLQKIVDEKLARMKEFLKKRVNN
jgi:uncharacterized coiled-coil protein SlyX